MYHFTVICPLYLPVIWTLTSGRFCIRFTLLQVMGEKKQNFSPQIQTPPSLAVSHRHASLLISFKCLQFGFNWFTIKWADYVNVYVNVLKLLATFPSLFTLCIIYEERLRRHCEYNEYLTMLNAVYQLQVIY